ncbi:hypothetical protein [Morganella morganii]|uniref:hypothetical protein n=1 Tax=Morganella morganii TaxID=582 RepID=UPI0031B61CD7
MEKSGFFEPENNFTGKSSFELLNFFHGYGFKDKDGNDLVACKDFVRLIEQFCTHCERIESASPAIMILSEKALMSGRLS